MTVARLVRLAQDRESWRSMVAYVNQDMALRYGKVTNENDICDFQTYNSDRLTYSVRDTENSRYYFQDYVDEAINKLISVID